MWTVVFPVLPGQTGSSPDIPPVSLLLPVSVAGVEVAGEAAALTVSLQHPRQTLLTVRHGQDSPQVPTELLGLGESQGEVEGSVNLHIGICQADFCSLNVPQLEAARDDEVGRVPGESVPGHVSLTARPGSDLWPGESSAPDVDIAHRPVTGVASVVSDLIQQGDVGWAVSVAAITRVVLSLELELLIEEHSKPASLGAGGDTD